VLRPPAGLGLAFTTAARPEEVQMRRLEDAHGAQEREGKINRDEAVSLSFELTDLEDAIEGAVILAECLVTDQLNEDQMIRLPAAVVAALVQVQTRIRQLRRVVRGERDAREIRNRHNVALEDPGDGDDILLGVDGPRPVAAGAGQRRQRKAKRTHVSQARRRG
jgi:hypothetical protein